MKHQTHLRFFSSLLLLLTAAIWGFAFVAQSVSMDYIDPCTFTFSRSLIGGIVLLPLIFVLDKKQAADAEKSKQTQVSGTAKWRQALCGGICCGVALGFASLAQQFGIKYTSVGKAGFITTLYIIIVPFLGVFLHKKIGLKIWISAVIAALGLYLICMSESLRIGTGDALVMLCALLFAFQILLVDHFSPKADPVRISCIQFFAAAAVSGVGMLLFEHPQLSSLLAAAAPILYAGVLSSGVGYTLQVVAQRNTDPTVASLLMSLESVFATLAGWLLLHQTLSPKELFGCALVFAAVILAQLPDLGKA